MENLDVAALLEELADLLEIKGADRFRVGAYRTAARTIETLPRRLTDFVEAGVPLTELPGIGKEISRRILEILVRNAGRLVTRQTLLQDIWGSEHVTDTGYLRLYLSQLRKKLEPDPAAPRYLLTDPGMGYRFDPSGGGA